MPVVFRYDDVTVTVEVRDEHPPMHVHVKSSKYQVKIDISGSEPTLMRESKKSRIRTNSKFTKEALRQVKTKLSECKNVWRAYHGE